MKRPEVSPSPFGQHLRHWRSRAGLSQLELAAQASTTARHVSFIETGRSRPGRELILRLADVLDVPLRERNAMLASAGFARAFASMDLGEEAMKPLAQVLDRILRTHEPYPAWVVGAGLRFLQSNRAAESLFPGLCDLAPESIVDLWYGPGPFRGMVQNWPDVIWAGIASLRREASRAGDPTLFALLRRAEALAISVPRPTSSGVIELPIVSPRLAIGDRVIRTLSAVMRFDAPVEVTASELRVELMYPADAESEAFFSAAARDARETFT